jgi:hypothetical protein
MERLCRLQRGRLPIPVAAWGSFIPSTPFAERRKIRFHWDSQLGNSECGGELTVHHALVFDTGFGDLGIDRG